MKLSTAQKNYLNAKALMESALDAAAGNGTEDDALLADFEEATELVEIRETELLGWAKNKAVVLSQMFNKSAGDIDTVIQLFDKCLNGDYVRYDTKQRLIELCVKLESK